MDLAYQRFSDPRAASRFLAERQEARLLGGGTLLVRRVNEGDVSIGAYVHLLAPELEQIEVGDKVVLLGAGVTMSRIANTPALDFLPPVARSIGGPAVRAAATVGGNLFAPSPYGDFGVALLASVPLWWSRTPKVSRKSISKASSSRARASPPALGLSANSSRLADRNFSRSGRCDQVCCWFPAAFSSLPATSLRRIGAVSAARLLALLLSNAEFVSTLRCRTPIESAMEEEPPPKRRQIGADQIAPFLGIKLAAISSSPIPPCSSSRRQPYIFGSLYFRRGLVGYRGSAAWLPSDVPIRPRRIRTRSPRLNFFLTRLSRP